jgi:DNA-binding IclR family transcriptional regulator
MSIQSAREDAVLDALVRRKTGTIGEIMAALDGNGMSVGKAGATSILAGLIRRGLVRRTAAGYGITEAGQASVRRRKHGYSARPLGTTSWLTGSTGLRLPAAPGRPPR